MVSELALFNPVALLRGQGSGTGVKIFSRPIIVSGSHIALELLAMQLPGTLSLHAGAGWDKTS